MGRFLSQAIRMYEHATDGTLLSRNNYNYQHGMILIESLLKKPIPMLKLVGIGSEGGAMVIHLRWNR